MCGLLLILELAGRCACLLVQIQILFWAERFGSLPLVCGFIAGPLVSGSTITAGVIRVACAPLFCDRYFIFDIEPLYPR